MSPDTSALASPPKGSQLRSLVSPEMPRGSSSLGVAFATADHLLLGAGAALFVLSPWWVVKAVGVAVEGVAVAMLFALAHDAAHGSLAGSPALNRLLATICFLPSWYPFTPWIRGHNHLHHGWTNVAECDYSWRPVSPADYRAMPRWRRVLERVYRSWWGLWLHSIVEIWWKHMAMPRASDRRYLNTWHLNADRLLVFGVVGAQTALCWWLGPGWSTRAGGPAMPPLAVVAGVVLMPWWVFHVMFSTVTFLHHTHPQVRWVRTRHESNFFGGQVAATVHVELPSWVELLLHNITVHGAHHVDPRIPFRNLPEAQRCIESEFPDRVIVTRWSMRAFINVTRWCQLYDYDTHEWRQFQ
jgi:omega-6 fatty acid desaturase (delta-12 desaturase)